MYILIHKLNSDNPEILLDASGLLRWFETEDEAEDYASSHHLEEYEIFELCDK